VLLGCWSTLLTGGRCADGLVGDKKGGACAETAVNVPRPKELPPLIPVLDDSIRGKRATAAESSLSLSSSRSTYSAFACFEVGA